MTEVTTEASKRLSLKSIEGTKRSSASNLPVKPPEPRAPTSSYRQHRIGRVNELHDDSVKNFCALHSGVDLNGIVTVYRVKNAASGVSINMAVVIKVGWKSFCIRVGLAVILASNATVSAVPAFGQASAPTQTTTIVRKHQVPSLRRGINIGDYLAYPSAEPWPIFRGPRASTTDDELRRLKAAGFDFVRLAVEPSPLLDRSAAETRQIEARLTAMVKRISATGLRVMISGWARHETTPGWRAADIIASTDSPAYRRYVGFLKRIVELLKDLPPDHWVLEPMNEPQAECRRTDGPDWTMVQHDIYRQIRAVAPTLTVVLTPGCWSKIEALQHLDMAGYDARTLIDVHYYEPWIFTHQSATWNEDWIKHLAGLSFPPVRTNVQSATDASARLFVKRDGVGGSAAFKETLRRIDGYLKDDFGPERIWADFANLRAWADKQSISPDRIIVGEFGAYRQPADAKNPDDGSRARWIETVRLAAERQGFGWALYAYHSDFGLIMDEVKATWDPTIPPALGLTLK
jgi:endoglucanase